MAEKEKKVAEKNKPNAFIAFFKRAGKFLRDCKGEVKRIVWPTPKATFKNTGVVLATTVVMGAFIYGLDYLFAALLSLVMQLNI